MTQTTALSANALALLSALKSGNIWEENAIAVIFPKPQYVGTMDPAYTDDEKAKIQTAYWQYDINIYGGQIQRPVLGAQVWFYANVETTFSDTARAAYKELQAASLAVAKNAGSNTYYYQYTGQ